MFIKEIKEINVYDYVSKYGKKFKAPRIRTLYKLKCDSSNCGIIFTKIYWSCKKEGKHICFDCVSKYGNSINCKMGDQARREQSLSKIGNIREGSRGYPEIYVGYDYPYSTPERKKRLGHWIFEHRYIMESKIKKPIPKGYVIHHIDGDKFNNNINNLYLCTGAEHNRCHAGVGGILTELFKENIIIFNKNTVQYNISKKTIKILKKN